MSARKYHKKGFIPKEAGDKWKQYRNNLHSMTISDSGLVMKDEKMILPRSLWDLAIEKAHQGGHPGETKMKSRIRNHFWIPDLNKFMKEKVSTCESDSPRKPQKNRLHHTRRQVHHGRK